MTNPDDIRKLYQSLSEDGYTNLGTEDEFRNRLNDENNVKSLYNSLVEDGYTNLGTEEEFRGRLLAPAAEPQASQSAEPRQRNMGTPGTMVGATPWVESPRAPRMGGAAPVATPAPAVTPKAEQTEQQPTQAVEQAEVVHNRMQALRNVPNVFTPTTAEGEAIPDRQTKEDFEKWEATTEQGKKNKLARLTNNINKYNPDFDAAAKSAWDAAGKRQAQMASERVERDYGGWRGALRFGMQQGGGDFGTPVKTDVLEAQTEYFKTHDLQKMMDDSWQMLGDKKRNAIIDDYVAMLKQRYATMPPSDDAEAMSPEEAERILREAAEKMARQESNRHLYNLAVKKNAPKNVTDFIVRKAMESNIMWKAVEAAARVSAGTTGDMQARDEAMQNYEDSGHKAAGLTGMVIGYTADPSMALGGVVGKGAATGVRWLGGKVAGEVFGKTASRALGKEAGRVVGREAGEAWANKAAESLLGRMALGSVGGAGTFATFEGLGEAAEQMRYGGTIDGVDEETGLYNIGDYDASAIMDKVGHGALLGAGSGIIAPGIGNLADRAVRATNNVAGKTVLRGTQLGTNIAAEGAMFSLPQWIKGDGDWFDVWTDNMAMVASFKLQHAILSAPQRIEQLSKKPESKEGFFTRYSRMLDGNPSLALTNEEKDELHRGGYDDLLSLVEDRRIYEKNKDTGTPGVVVYDQNREGSRDEKSDLPYNRFLRMIDDPQVSEAARAKMYYYLTGERLPMSTVESSNIIEYYDDKGNVKGYTVQAKNAKNGVITSHNYKSKKEAEAELERINRQIELNAIDLGERAYDNAADVKRMREACEKFGRRYDTPENVLMRLMQMSPSEMSRVQADFAREIMSIYNGIKPTKSADLRTEINKQYGVDVDKAIAKEPKYRSKAEKEALSDYAKRLYGVTDRGMSAGAKRLEAGLADPNTPVDENGEPMEAEMSRGYDADEQQRSDIAIEVAEGKEGAEEAWRGVVQRINDDAAMMAAQQRVESWRRQFRGEGENKGALRPVTITMKNGEQREVYLTQGELALTESGLVDPEKTKELNNVGTLTAYDPAEGREVSFAPSDIVEVGQMTTAEQQEQNIENNKLAYLQQQMDAATGRFNPQPGQEVDMGNGNTAIILATDGDNVTLQMPDGSQESQSIADIQQIADGVMMNDYQQRHPEEQAQAPAAEQQTSEAPTMTEGKPQTFEPNMELTIQDGDGEKTVYVTGTRARWNPTVGYVEDPNGKFVELYDPEANNGNGGMTYIRDDDPDGKIVGYKAAPREEQPAEETTEPTAEQPMEETPEAPAETPTEEVEQQLEEEQPAPLSSVMPMKKVTVKRDMVDENGKPVLNKNGRPKKQNVEEEVEDWYAATPDDAYKYLYEEAVSAGLDVKDADAIVKLQREQAQKELDAIKKKPEPVAGSVMATLQMRKERNAEIEEAQSHVDYWKEVREQRQNVLAEELKRKEAERLARETAEQRAKREAFEAEQARRKAEAEEIERRRQEENEQKAAGTYTSPVEMTDNNEPVEGSKKSASPLAIAKRELADDADAMAILNDTEPQTLEEMAAFVLKSGKGQKGILPESFYRHTGYGPEEAKAFSLILSNNGETIEHLGEVVEEHARNAHIPFDENYANAGLNAVMAVLTDVKSQGEINGYISNNRIREAYARHNWKMAQEDAYMSEQLGVTRAEYDGWVKGMEEKAEAVKNMSEEEFNTIFGYYDTLLTENRQDNDRRAETDNGGTGEESADALQGEQREGNASGTPQADTRGVGEDAGGESAEPAVERPAGEVAESREEREQRLQEERKQRILAEGTDFDKPFGLTPVSETMTAEEIGANVRRIVEGLKQNEGGNDGFEGFAYNGNYKKNAGHQVDEYLVSLSGVVPDETLRQWYESEGLKTRDDLRKLGESLYAEQADNVRSQKGMPAAPTAEQKALTKGIVGWLNNIGIPAHAAVRKGQEMLNKYREMVRALRAYHGSGADFDRFDHSHMGEGEGNQSFGYGTYVTQVKDIGKHYAESAGSLADHNFVSKYKGQTIAFSDLSRIARSLINEFNGDIDALRGYLQREKDRAQSIGQDYVRDYDYNKVPFKEVDKAIEQLSHPEDFEISKNSKTLYEVEIPDDNGDNYLSYDKRELSEKRQNDIKEALRNNEKIREKYRKTYDEIMPQIIARGTEVPPFEEWYEGVIDVEGDQLDMAGGSIYQQMERLFGSPKAASEFLHSVGFVGIKYPADYYNGGRSDGAKNYVIFDEGDLKITDKIRFQRAADGEYEPSPVFYSNAMNAVEGIKQEKATAEQWLAMLQKNGGLKAGEDKWIGLSDWLNDHKGKSLTKQEVIDYIRENQIQVEEVKYGNNGDYKNKPRMKELQSEYEGLVAQAHEEERRMNHEFVGFDDEMTEKYGVGWMDRLDEGDRKRNDELTARYEKYKNPEKAAFADMAEKYGDDFENAFEIGSDGLQPKTDYYTGKPTEEARRILNIEDKDINETRLQYTTDFLDNKREVALVVPTIEPWNEGDEVHFGDAGEGRAVAWVRFGETTDADGKRVLVIDEIQSKRHQEGREKGYRKESTSELINKQGELERRRIDMVREFQKTHPDDVNNEAWDAFVNSKEYKDILKEESETEDKIRASYNLIPDAPFDKNWHEVAMKWALRYAAENGYDKVAWTKGEQQAKRYDLSNKVDEINVSGGVDNLFTVEANRGDSFLFQKDVEGEKGIADIIGKDLARKAYSNLKEGKEDYLNEDGVVSFTGDNLVIGGEGMKGFYDQMLPRYMDKYGKKWNVKTTDIYLPNIGDNGLTMHSVDVTPEMKASVLQGQPMFFRDKGGEVIGYTLNGEIYIDPRYAKPETPVHEYTHLIVHAIRANNPRVWERWKELAHGEQDVIDFVKEKYPEYSENEDDFWEEVITTYTGREGGKRLEEEMRKQMRETPDIAEKARIATIFHKLRDLLKRFWDMTKDIFSGSTKGIDNFKSMDDVVDLTLAALANKFDPRAAQKAAEEKTLMGVHNISEEKLKKALKQGGFANPSMAVIDTKNGGFDSYGDISLIPKASLIDARTGRNAGTYGGDAWTPTYPGVEYYEGKETEKRLEALTAGLPESLGEHIRRRVSDYMDKNRSTSGLEYLFLKEHGIDMPIAHNERRLPNISSKQIHERMGVSENIYGSDLYKEYEKIPQEQLFDFNLWLDKYGDETEIAKVNDMIARLRSEGKDKAADMLVDRYSKPMTFANFDTHVYNVGRDEREAGSENLNRTIENAAMEVDKQGLRNEFDAWLEKQINNLGYEERLFAGFTPSGNRRYLPNTLENASKLMNRESDVNAYDDTGLNATRAALMYKMQSLDDIRQHRDLLQNRSDAYDKRQYEMSNKLFDLAQELSDMQVISDNPFSNIDYAIRRMQDAFTKKDPIGYLNKEYGYSIDKDSDFAKQMLSFMEEVKDMPVKYFETKFKRPVMLDEFAVAVVPEGTSEDVVKALQDAGLDVRTYDGTPENRQAVTLDAVRGRNDIMFQKAGTYTTRDGVQLSMISLFEEGDANLNDNANLNDKGDLTNLRLRKLAPGETCHVERRYEENKSFSFVGKEKIESMDDVAYIFKQLETAAVENAFIALVKDGKPTIIHVGMGTYTSSPVDFKLAFPAYKEIQPDAVYVIHNHPGGSIIASTADREMLASAKKFFGEDVVKDGIIIDTVSGKYGTFSLTGRTEENMPESEEGEVELKTYEFSKQVFSPDWKPKEAIELYDSQSIAAFVSSQRLGAHPKMSFIVINTQKRIVGNYFLPWTALSEIDDVRAASEEMSNYIHLSGGTKGILYGNYQYGRGDKRKLQSIAAGMKSIGTPLLDVVHVDVNDNLGYHSAHDSGVMEPEEEYVTPKREAGENILDYAKRVADDYSAYEAIMKAYEEMEGGVMEVHDDSVDDYDSRDMGKTERMTAMAANIAARNAADAEAKNRAYKAIGNNLADLRKAMSLQKEFDKGTVKRVADLARTLLRYGYLDNMSRGEMGRLLSAVKNSTGKADISGDIRKVMDIMIDSQLRAAENALKDMEKVKASKVDAKGVEVQGVLDVRGQQIMKTFKETRGWSEDELSQAMAEAENRMASDDNAVADQAMHEYDGLQMALEYVQNIKASIKEERDLRQELADARSAEDRSREYEQTLMDAIQQNKAERVQAYHDLMKRLGDYMRFSIERAREFKEAEKERVREIQHNANSDMEGRPSNEHYKPKWKDKMVNNNFVQFFFKPLATFDQMLRLFGSKSANGEGYLYSRFMRGWVDAREKEIRGVREKYAQLDEKVHQIFGDEAKSMADLIRLTGKMPKATLLFKDGGEMKEHELTQGNLMYIYMVNKMLDGRMKLRKMGIDEKKVAEAMRILDPRLIELADWMQKEFLVDTRNEYNETHKRLFGANMAAIEDYFPLKINANARVDKAEDLDNFDQNEGISTKTGSIIKRRMNSLALDVLNADALNVILDHVAQMEHWNAFAEFNRDLNTLRTYKHFRNQVKNMTTIYGSGDKLWQKFNDVSQMAAGTYRPKRADLDVAATNIAKGVTAAKVSFRIFTALKQFLSMPAYLPDARPDLWAKNLATPWVSWNWAMENLPIFEERWKSRMAGDPRLMKSELDWKGWRNNIVQMASRIGMSPNAFVDALTVSIGAKTIYESRKARYLKEGYSEEQADKKAKQDAEIAYNQTQQSSEGAFLSTMQVDRSWLSVMFTVFRNSSMAYQRQLHDALRNLKRDLKKGNREESIEFMKKQMVREGVPEDKAEEAAKARYNRQVGKDVLRVATFGYILQFCWNLGAYLPYLLFGDDDDKKNEMWDDILAKSMFGWAEGLTGGDVMSEGGKMLKQGEGNPEYLKKEMPVSSDAYKVLQELGQGKYGEVVNDMINLVVQMGVGVNPQSITDAVLAIMDACGDDPELAHEATIAVMRILQVPQSQIKEMYFDEVGLSGDEVSNYTPVQLAERYAKYQVKRGRLLAPWTWDDEGILDKKRKAANKAIKERVKEFGKEYDEALADYEVKYNEVNDHLKAAIEEAKKERSYVQKAQIVDEVRRLDEKAYETYEDFKKYDKQLDDMVGKYLKAETTAQAALAKDDIEGFKSRMVELLGTEDEKERNKLRFQLNEYYADFKREYEAAGSK